MDEPKSVFYHRHQVPPCTVHVPVCSFKWLHSRSWHYHKHGSDASFQAVQKATVLLDNGESAAPLWSYGPVCVQSLVDLNPAVWYMTGSTAFATSCWISQSFAATSSVLVQNLSIIPKHPKSISCFTSPCFQPLTTTDLPAFSLYELPLLDISYNLAMWPEHLCLAFYLI